MSAAQRLQVTLGLIPLMLLGLCVSAEPHDPLSVGVSLTLESAHLVDQAHPSGRGAERRALISIPISLDLAEVSERSLGLISAQAMVIKEDPRIERDPLLYDVHAYSNMRAEDRAQLFELYWERSWGALTTRLGKLDANDHFAVSEFEAKLINGAAGFSPSIYGLPSYPDSAWSAQLGYKMERLDLSMAVFDGGSTTLSPVPTGARLWLSDAARAGGLFWVAQLSAHLGGTSEAADQREGAEQALPSMPQGDRGFEARAPLHLSLGAWTHRGEVVPTEDGSGEPGSGLYLTSDLSLLSYRGGGELGAGLQVAWSPAYHPLHISAALTASELSPALPWAQQGLSLALGLSYLNIIEDPSRSERFGELHEQLYELTASLPISGSALMSLSALYLYGHGLLDPALSGARGATLVVGRLTLGVF